MTIHKKLHIVVSTEGHHEAQRHSEKLAEAGFIFEEGGGHTRVYDKNGVFRSIIGRHVEIPERTVYEIQRQTGIKLKP